MKIIINTSNLYVGGGLQVALSFINELKNISNGYSYHVFLSKAIEKQLDLDSFSSQFNFYLIENSPASLTNRSKIVKKLNYLEKRISPDIVFSVFGPTYWTPKTKHIMGFAVPWILQPKSVAYSQLKFFDMIKMKLRMKYISSFVKKNASYFIIETQDGKNRLSDVLSIHKKNIFVVGNSYSSNFNDEKYLMKNNLNYIELPKREKNEFRLLLISHNYPHKNLQIINKVIPLLDGYNVKFVLTLDEKNFLSLFSKNNVDIINLGPVNQKSCPSLYEQTDALFLPTLLEVFSASYPESMKMKKPILTSNYSFARDVCGDSALFFNPLDEYDIVDKIKMLIRSNELRMDLIRKGEERLTTFESAKSRAEKYIQICEQINKEENNV